MKHAHVIMRPAMNPTPRALIPPQRPKRWRVTLEVVDTPGPGEDYLSKEDLLDNVLKRKAHAGVGVLHEEAVEDPVPVFEGTYVDPALDPRPPVFEGNIEVVWPADPRPPELTPPRESFSDRVAHWLGRRKI